MNIFKELFNISEIGQLNRLTDLEEKFDKNVNDNTQDIFKLKELISINKDMFEQLALLFRSLYDHCIDKNVFTKNEFKKYFENIDIEDGKKDGKLKKK